MDPFLHGNSKDFDQTWQIPKLIRVASVSSDFVGSVELCGSFIKKSIDLSIWGSCKGMSSMISAVVFFVLQFVLYYLNLLNLAESV